MPDIYQIAGVPLHLHEDIDACLELARKKAKGLLWHKVKVRFWRAGKIAKMLKWEDERLYPRHPSWDIAPMGNITAHGDNVPWQMTPDGGRPLPGAWLNPDPSSSEYKEAVAANYWCKGEHPRSRKSRKAWYRRNGGEYEAYKRGWVLTRPGVDVWSGAKGRVTVDIIHTSGAYSVNVRTRLFGGWHLVSRKGFEVDNVAWRSQTQSNWWPIQGHVLRAPVTWSIVLRRIR